MLRHKSVLVSAEPGFGKTVLAAEIIRSAVYKNKTVFFVCHRQELVVQTSLTLKKAGIQHSFIAAGFDYCENFKVQICSVGTLVLALPSLEPPDLIIFDETHHIAAKQWAKIYDWGQGYTIGLTGTPCRLDGKGLGEYYTDMVSGPQPKWLIDNGYLSDYRYFNPIGFSGTKKIGGDFALKDLAEQAYKADITNKCVESYIKHAKGRRSVAYECNIERSQELAMAFMGAGIKAMHIDGGSDEERKEAGIKLATGEIEVICNVGLISEGYDLSAQAGMDVTIDCVVMNRPTASLSLFLQQAMRGMRRKQYPAIILDHADNARRHRMLPCSERDWKLTKGKEKATVVEDLIIKQCEFCYFWHRSSHRCPNCDKEPQASQRDIAEIEKEIAEIEKAKFERDMKSQEYKAETIEDWLAIAAKRGYKDEWAYIRHDLRTAKNEGKRRK